MENRKILISGAGVAGPVLAYWLQRYGFEPTVVERSPTPRPGGQTVDLRGASRVVVERMGLLDAVRAVAVQQKGIAWVDAGGRPVARMSTADFGGEGIVSEIEVLRGDLAGVLHGATEPVVEHLFDDTITGLDQDEEGVTVSFESATARRFGLVVGADGLHSTVRALAFGREAEYVRGIDCHTAWFTAPADVPLDGWFLMYNAPGGRVASVRPGRLPSEMKVGLTFRARSLRYDRRDIGEQQDLLSHHFADAGWEVPRLLAAMRGATDFTFDSMGQVHLDSFSRGRAAVLGDAAWCPTPLTGQGTSLAVVGAYVLAGELALVDGRHRAALAAYDRIMRPYVTRAQQLPPGGARSYAPMRPSGIRMQRELVRWMGRWPLRTMMAAQLARSAAVELPTYGAA